MLNPIGAFLFRPFHAILSNFAKAWARELQPVTVGAPSCTSNLLEMPKDIRWVQPHFWRATPGQSVRVKWRCGHLSIWTNPRYFCSGNAGHATSSTRIIFPTCQAPGSLQPLLLISNLGLNTVNHITMSKLLNTTENCLCSASQDAT